MFLCAFVCCRVLSCAFCVCPCPMRASAGVYVWHSHDTKQDVMGHTWNLDVRGQGLALRMEMGMDMEMQMDMDMETDMEGLLGAVHGGVDSVTSLLLSILPRIHPNSFR